MRRWIGLGLAGLLALGVVVAILGILPKIDRLGPGSQDSFVVQKTVTDYLPSTLQAYLNLPRAYATVPLQ